MIEVKPYRLGVVEGFFGKSWSWEARTQYAQFLSSNGFSTYIYAPKNDQYFRKQWAQACPPAHHDALTRLSSHYTDAGIEFAIGLSPFELYLDFSSEGQQALERKLEEINAINPDTLCILFDDMHGAIDDLADRQLRIMDFVTRISKASHFIFCPTYYSDDPVLGAHFGPMPAHYLEDLGGQLDSRIDIFWTGPKVFSTDFPDDHLLDIGERLHRKPLLWDNYPVNDSQKLAGHLNLKPFENRSSALKSLTKGHMSNPMNQPFLSQIPLYSLSQFHQGSESNRDDMLQEACAVLCSAELGELLQSDIADFQDKGLANFSDKKKAEIVERYTPYQNNPMVIELFDWLKGEYAFDPECLT